MRRILLMVATFMAIAAMALGQPALPPDFKQQTVTMPDGAQIHVRSGGSGPAVLLIHGFGDGGEMWGPVARALRKTHTLVIPDLRGMGRSWHPAGGYDKRTQAADLRAVMLALGIDRSAVAGQDIGNMVAYAYSARYPDKVERLIVMVAPIPGIDPWDEVAHSPQTWHFYFRGPDVERLVQGRERILLDRFYNELSAHPERIDEATRAHYASVYAQPGAMHCIYTLENQSELAGLICESFAFQVPAPDFALAVFKGLSHVAPQAHVLHLENEDFSRDPKVVQTMNEDPLIAHETQPAQTLAEMVRADERLKAEFPHIKLPVMILHGTADKAAKPSGSRFFYDMAGSSDKTLKLYDGGFHDLLNDTDRQTVLSDIRRWITERAGGARRTVRDEGPQRDPAGSARMGA